MVLVDAITQVFAAKRTQIRAQLMRESFEVGRRQPGFDCWLSSES